jgi:hypothetical protein
MSDTTESQPLATPTSGDQDRVKGASGANDASSELKVGDVVRVADRGDKHHGRVGVVEEIVDYDDDYTVWIAFEGGSHPDAFMRDALSFVWDDADTHEIPLSPTTARWNLNPPREGLNHVPRKASASDGPPLQTWWHQLSRGARRGVLIASVGFGIVLAIGIATSVGGHSASNQAASLASSPGSNAQISSGASTSDQWESSVCKLGTFHNGGGLLRNATGSGSCLADNGSGPIFIGQYQGTFGLQNDAVLFRGCAYATITDNTGTTWAFIAPARGSLDGATVLSPLAAFGFRTQTT